MASVCTESLNNSTIIFNPISITHCLHFLLMKYFNYKSSLFLFVLLFPNLPFLLPIERCTGEKRLSLRKQTYKPALFPSPRTTTCSSSQGSVTQHARDARVDAILNVV